MANNERSNIATKAQNLIATASACDLCRTDLPLEPRPIFQVNPLARILVAGQAPGAKTHEQGIPFDDASGNRLRDWMGLDRANFYDPTQVAILPMGFCYPGRARSGDLPPLTICAATWREKFLQVLPNIQLTLLVGQYAQQWHLPNRNLNVTQTVAAWREYGSNIPLPHPSPRNNAWLKKNPWFESELLLELKKRVSVALS